MRNIKKKKLSLGQKKIMKVLKQYYLLCMANHKSKGSAEW